MLLTVEIMCRIVTLVRENLKTFPLFVLIALGIALTTPGVGGANYYVDFASGSDNNNGASATAPWMHCPGDKAALGISAATALKPGDNVYFKGGVTYRNPQIYCANGSLVCTGAVAGISLAGVLMDTTANFSAAGVQSGDLLYIYNGTTNGAFLDSCGVWTVTNITSSTLTVQGFDAVPDLKSELTYVVCRPITFTTNANFGSGPAILDGSSTNRWYFQYGNYDRFSGLTFQNSKDVVGGGCTDVSWGIFYENTGGSWSGLFIDSCLFTNTFNSIYLDSTNRWTVFQNNKCINYQGFGANGGAYSLCQNNYFTNGVDGPRFFYAYSIIRFNTIIGMFSSCVDHSDGIGPIFSPSAAPGSNVYGWIYSNFIENAVQGIFLEYNNKGCYGWTIANNILVGHLGDGTGTGAYAIFADGAAGTRIYNNTLLGTNNAAGWIAAIVVGEKDATAYGASNSINVVVKNNIIYNPSTLLSMGVMHIYDTAYTNGFVAEGNVYYEPNWGSATLFALDNNISANHFTFAQWQARGFDNAGASTLNVDPMLITANGLYPSGLDVRLATNSPALASPYSLPVNLRDAGRVLRYGGSPWDRGAYQTTKTLRLNQPLGGLHIVPQ